MVEGSSLLILLFIAMPLKYKFGYANIIPYVGWSHGLLWLLYLVLAIVISHKRGWSVVFCLLVIFVSVTPFAFLFLDRKLKNIIAADYKFCDQPGQSD